MAYYRGAGLDDVGGWLGGRGEQWDAEATEPTEAEPGYRPSDSPACHHADPRPDVDQVRQIGVPEDAAESDVSCNRYSSDKQCGRALTPEQVSLLSWLESQCSVTRVWLDRLIAEGDPDDMVSVIHRQAAWLDLIRQRLDRG